MLHLTRRMGVTVLVGMLATSVTASGSPGSSASGVEPSRNAAQEEIFADLARTYGERVRQRGHVTLSTEKPSDMPSGNDAGQATYLARDEGGTFAVNVLPVGDELHVQVSDHTRHTLTPFVLQQSGDSYVLVDEPSPVRGTTTEIGQRPAPDEAKAAAPSAKVIMTYCLMTVYPPYRSVGYAVAASEIHSCTMTAILNLRIWIELWSGYNWYVYNSLNQSTNGTYWYRNVLYSCTGSPYRNWKNFTIGSATNQHGSDQRDGTSTDWIYCE